MELRARMRAAVAALFILPALLGATPTSADAPRAVLSNAVTETTPVRVAINGGPAQHLGLIGYDDVVGLHPGRNTLTVRWAGPVKRLDFRITYSTSPDNVKDVLVVRSDAAHDASLRRAGSRTYTFVIPRT